MSDEIKVGDVVLFDNPTQWWGPGDPVLGCSENMKLGLVLSITDDVLSVCHDGERNNVHISMCSPVKERDR
jgi:hypothetical protein